VDIGQRLIGALARAVVWLFYRAERVGPPVPEGPALLVANHPNALLDPAMVWTTSGRATRFLAKSTLFKGPFAPLMRASGALPVYRRADAGEDTSRNAEMFAAVARALADGEAVCIFPEGTTHSRGRLDPLRSGAARIALASEAAGVGVSIVPVGLNPNQKAVFRSRAAIFYGPAFRCADLVPEYRREPAAAVRTLTERITDRLRSLIVEANPSSELHLVDRIDELYCGARGLQSTAEARIARQRLIASGLADLRARDENRLEMVLHHVRAYDTALARVGLSDSHLEGSYPGAVVRRFVIREALLAVVLLPLAAAGYVLFAVPYLVTDLIARVPAHLEVKSTWKLIGGALVYGAWVAGLASIAAVFLGWTAAALVLLLVPALGLLALAAIEHEDAVWDAIRAYVLVRSTPTSLKRRLVRRRGELAALLEQTQSWLENRPQGSQG
jgi:1-acyl-sn-glycerol-3-phosphate acyltransferase